MCVSVPSRYVYAVKRHVPCAPSLDPPFPSCKSFDRTATQSCCTRVVPATHHVKSPSLIKPISAPPPQIFAAPQPVTLLPPYLPSLHLPAPHPLPKPPQPPDPPHAPTFLAPPPLLHRLAPPALPHAAHPLPKPILDALALHRARLGHQRRRHAPLHILARQHAARDQRLGRRPHRKPARQPDGRQGARELAADDGRVGEEDAARDEVTQAGARGRRQERREHGARVAEAEAVEDGRECEGAELMRCLFWGERWRGDGR